MRRCSGLEREAGDLQRYTEGVHARARPLPTVRDVASYLTVPVRQSQLEGYYEPNARLLRQRLRALKAAEVTLALIAAVPPSWVSGTGRWCGGKISSRLHRVLPALTAGLQPASYRGAVPPGHLASSRHSPATSVKLVSNSSARRHRSLAVSRPQVACRGGISSIPNTRGGSGSVSSVSAWAAKCRAPPASSPRTLPPRPTPAGPGQPGRPLPGTVGRSPAPAAGISAMDAMNALRGQGSSRHRYCRLCQQDPYRLLPIRQVSWLGSAVLLHRRPHHPAVGAAAALLAAVATCTNRPRPSPGRLTLCASPRAARTE